MYQKANDRLKNQTCIVTGANTGIGREVAVAIAKDGANVVVNWVANEEATADVLNELSSIDACYRAIEYKADISKENEVKAMFKDVIDTFGTVDILINNAGLQRDAPLHEMTLDQWQLVIDVNLTGQFLCAREAIREFLRRGPRPDVTAALGKIICMSSVHEIIPWAGHANYAASKGGVNLLMQSIAQEYGRKKIRVNSIAPGAIQTPINKDAWETEQALNKLLELIPYDRIGQSSDVGSVAVWLASDESDYITGTTIVVDGGMTIYPGFTENGLTGRMQVVITNYQITDIKTMKAEKKRLQENYEKNEIWYKWGPYLSERQWGTVREDYSPHGTAWEYFPHDHARSRTYRWGEDGIAGISDNQMNLCFSIAMWNGKDPIIKERIFGLTGNEGNHGEDCKDLYYYLDNTPTHSYMRHLYKYPQEAFPYEDLVRTNENRSKKEPEYEILDTGIFNDGKYFDVFTEYAKNNPEDMLINITVHNRSSKAASLVLLPTLWFRNRWSFGLVDEKPVIRFVEQKNRYGYVEAEHPRLGTYYLYFEEPNQLLFTENETNSERIFDAPNETPYVKDAINDAVVSDDFSIFEEKKDGTKFSPMYQLKIKEGSKKNIRLRLVRNHSKSNPLKKSFSNVLKSRKGEADEFYAGYISKSTSTDLKNVQRQAFAGMLWTKQYYNINVEQWLEGDPGQPDPPEERKSGRNSDWKTLNNEDIISMPDKWEYPWYAAWDLAFHCVPLALIDPEFAKNQLILFTREWYMHPNGQIPAYEWAFGDVNPPVQAWATMKVFKLDKQMNGKGDIEFLKRMFNKLTLNFTWWVNRKDHNGNNVFEGGFLGLDNIGVFDRSSEMPGGGTLEQADGTSWMAMYCLNMLAIAIEIAHEDPAYEDVTTKFFEHFVYISESLNRITEDWTGSWDEKEGFFYDILALPDGRFIPLKVRSLVGLTTLFAVLKIDKEAFKNLKDFKKRMRWFRNYRKERDKYLAIPEELNEDQDLLLSLIPRDRLQRLLQAMLDVNEFLSPAGIRSVSKIHEDPYRVTIDGKEFGLKYEPGESTTGLFGGNSNWRGPVWFPMNYLIVESLKEHCSYYKEDCQVECPYGSGRFVNLEQVADDLCDRMTSVFIKDQNGKRPVHGDAEIYHSDKYFQDLVLFYEYFHGDTARGVGATHQTGWTGLVAEMISNTT